MIRVVIAYSSHLLRGALAFVLEAEDDVEVVGSASDLDSLLEAMRQRRPNVAIVSPDILAGRSVTDILLRPSLDEPSCSVLLLVNALSRSDLQHIHQAWSLQSPLLGLLSADSPPERLAVAVRKLAGGERVLDPDVVVNAINAPQNPLTPREVSVLRAAVDGIPISEIADRLALSRGTVRNHLSRVIGKTGARTRMEAIRIAQDAGWL